MYKNIIGTWGMIHQEIQMNQHHQKELLDLQLFFLKKKTEEDSLHETIDTKNEVIKQKQHCMKLIEIIKQRD